MNEKTRTKKRHGQRRQAPRHYSTAATWLALIAMLTTLATVALATGVLLCP